jgi:hypothetical protein
VRRRKSHSAVAVPPLQQQGEPGRLNEPDRPCILLPQHMCRVCRRTLLLDGFSTTKSEGKQRTDRIVARVLVEQFINKCPARIGYNIATTANHTIHFQFLLRLSNRYSPKLALSLSLSLGPHRQDDFSGQRAPTKPLLDQSMMMMMGGGSLFQQSLHSQQGQHGHPHCFSFFLPSSGDLIGKFFRSVVF